MINTTNPVSLNEGQRTDATNRINPIGVADSIAAPSASPTHIKRTVEGGIVLSSYSYIEPTANSNRACYHDYREGRTTKTIYPALVSIMQTPSVSMNAARNSTPNEVMTLPPRTFAYSKYSTRLRFQRPDICPHLNDDSRPWRAPSRCDT
jgi:hypothetical protein